MHHLTYLSFLFMFFLSLRTFKFSFRKFQSYSTVLPTTVIMLYIILSLFILYLDVCTLLPTSASFPRPQNLIITFVFCFCEFDFLFGIYIQVIGCGISLSLSSFFTQHNALRVHPCCCIIHIHSRYGSNIDNL